MKTRTPCAMGLAALLIVASLPAFGSDYADDWAHADYSSLATGYLPHDMARKPGTDTIGIVFIQLVDGQMYLHYWEHYGEGQTLGGSILHVQENGVMGWPHAVSLAYTSEGVPAIALGYVCHYNVTPQIQDSYIRLAYLIPNPTWTCTYVDYEQDHRFDIGIWTLPRFASIDLAFDKRPGHVDEAHIVYGAWWDILTLEMYNDGDEPDEYAAVFAVDAPTPTGAWSARTDPPLYEIWGDTEQDPVHCPHVSLAMSAHQAPQVAFCDGDGHGATPENKVFFYGQWNGGWPTVGSPAYEPLLGSTPSLAVDPDSGEARVAYARYVWGEKAVYFSAKDAGVWSAPQQVMFAVGSPYGDPALAISKVGDALDTKVAYLEYNGEHTLSHVSEYIGGTWSLMSPYGRVSYCVSENMAFGTHRPRIALNPGAPSDPWVLTHFEGGLLGLAWYGTPPNAGGCSAPPLGRSPSRVPSILNALAPFGLALSALLAWVLWRRRHSDVRGDSKG